MHGLPFLFFRITFCTLFFAVVGNSARAQSLEFEVQSGHSNAVQALAFSPDGKLLASGSADATVRLWDVSTGMQLRTLTGHIRAVYSLAFTHDGKQLVSGGHDSARVWEVATGREVRRLACNFVHTLAVSPKGRYLAAVIGDDIRIWEAATWKELAPIKGSNGTKINSDEFIAFSDDEANLFTGGLAGVRAGWSLDTRRVLGAPPAGFRISGDDFAYGRGGALQARGGRDGGVSLKDLAANRDLPTLKGHSGRVTSVAFSQNSQLLASGGDIGDNAIKLWNVASGTELRTLRGRTDGVTSVAFSHDGKTLALAAFGVGDAGVVKLWDYATNGVRLLSGHGGFVYAVAFSPDGKILASGSFSRVEEPVAEGEDRGEAALFEEIKLWDVVSGRELRTLRGTFGTVRALAFSPDGKTLASGSLRMGHHAQGGELKLWRVENGEVVRVLDDRAQSMAVAFSPDGKTLASGGDIYDYSVKLWDVKTGASRGSASRHSSWVDTLAFSPDGKFLASGSRGEMKESGRCGDDETGELRLWSLRDRRQVRKFDEPNWVRSLAFTPDSATLLDGLGGDMGGVFSVKARDLASGRLRREYVGHTESVESVAVSPDGRRVATGSSDTTARLWAADTGELLASFINVDLLDQIVLTPDNYYAASRGALTGVAFRQGLRAFPFEQFDLRFNRPDLVLSKVGGAPGNLVGAYRKAYEKRLRRSGFGERPLSDVNLPDVALLSKDLPVFTGEKTFAFRVRAADAQVPLDRLNVYVNDVPAYGSRGIDLRPLKTKAVEQDVRVELSPGNNRIQVSAHNESGVESFRETLGVNYTGAARQPTLYVVAVGVSKYKDSRYDLTYADKDAGDVVDFFSMRNERGTVRALPLLNGEATKEAMSRVRDFLKSAGVDDQVVMFFAGHGMLDDRLDYYFGTADVNFDSPAERGLSYEEIEGLLDGVPARRKLLLMDTCHAGELDREETVVVAAAPRPAAEEAGLAAGVKEFAFRARPGKSYVGLGNSFALMQELFADLRRGSGAMVIAAAGGAEYAYESGDRKNGVFTFALLDALSGRADKNADGVTVSELRAFLVGRVAELTAGRQKPTVRAEAIGFDWVVK